ncbi:hypothetical protein G6514_007515 [Epicoccum nigrum]|nr:hypothetical protein G6514_007515 [Epicoccum nigrum]
MPIPPTTPAHCCARCGAERRNASNSDYAAVPTPRTPNDSVSLAYHLHARKAVPIARALMSTVLYEFEFTDIQGDSFAHYKACLERDKPDTSAPNFEKYERRINRWGEILEIQASQLGHLEALKLEHVMQVVMWGLECSKPEHE